MKKFFALILSILLCFVLIGCGESKADDGLTDTDTSSNEETEYQKSDEEKVIAMFLNNTQRDSDGRYRFLKRSSTGNVSFIYGFTYSPSNRLFTASIFITSYASVTLFDNAAVTFTWGQFKKGLFTAYHELDSIARIDFDYSITTFSNKNIGTQYSYTVRNNTFVNLTQKSEIDNYAAMGYEALQQAISYMNSVLNDHNLSIALF